MVKDRKQNKSDSCHTQVSKRIVAKHFPQELLNPKRIKVEQHQEKCDPDQTEEKHALLAAVNLVFQNVQPCMIKDRLAVMRQVLGILLFFGPFRKLKIGMCASFAQQTDKHVKLAEFRRVLNRFELCQKFILHKTWYSL